MLPMTRECFTSHMGHWLIHDLYMKQAVAAIRAGISPRAGPLDDDSDGGPPTDFVSVHDGIARISIDGPTMKGWSKFGGTSTIAVRNALRQAMTKDTIRGAMLKIDSPGGHVAGTEELANDVWNLQKTTGKPIHVHFEDVGASAAMWYGSQASRVTANATAMIGSVGVITVLEDSSEKFKAEGVKTHVITTGKHKATGMDGVELDEEQLEQAATMVQGLFGHFSAALRRGGMTAAQVAEVSDGRIVLAGEAQALGMIDAVASWDEAIGAFPKAPKRDRARAEWQAKMAAQTAEANTSL